MVKQTYMPHTPSSGFLYKLFYVLQYKASRMQSFCDLPEFFLIDRKFVTTKNVTAQTLLLKKWTTVTIEGRIPVRKPVRPGYIISLEIMVIFDINDGIPSDIKALAIASFFSSKCAKNINSEEQWKVIRPVSVLYANNF